MVLGWFDSITNFKDIHVNPQIVKDIIGYIIDDAQLTAL